MVSHMVQLLPKHSQSMWGWGMGQGGRKHSKKQRSETLFKVLYSQYDNKGFCCIQFIMLACLKQWSLNTDFYIYFPTISGFSSLQSSSKTCYYFKVFEGEKLVHRDMLLDHATRFVISQSLLQHNIILASLLCPSQHIHVSQPAHYKTWPKDFITK